MPIIHIDSRKLDIPTALKLGKLCLEQYQFQDARNFYSHAAKLGSPEAKMILVALICGYYACNGGIIPRKVPRAYQHPAQLFCQSIEAADQQIVRVLYQPVSVHAMHLLMMHESRNVNLLERLNTHLGWYVILTIWSKLEFDFYASFRTTDGLNEPHQLRNFFLENLTQLVQSPVLNAKLALLALRIYHRFFIPFYLPHYKLLFSADKNLIARLSLVAKPLIEELANSGSEQALEFAAYYHPIYAQAYFDHSMRDPSILSIGRNHLFRISENFPAIAEQMHRMYEFKSVLNTQLLSLQPTDDLTPIINLHSIPLILDYAKNNTYIAQNLAAHPEFFLFWQHSNILSVANMSMYFFIHLLQTSSFLTEENIKELACRYLGNKYSTNYLVDFILLKITDAQGVLKVVKKHPEIALDLLKSPLQQLDLHIQKKIALVNRTTCVYFLNEILSRHLYPKVIPNEKIDQIIYDLGVAQKPRVETVELFVTSFTMKCAKLLVDRQAYRMAANLYREIPVNSFEYSGALFEAGHLYFLLREKSLALKCFTLLSPFPQYGKLTALIKACQTNTECAFVDAISYAAPEADATTWGRFFQVSEQHRLSKQSLSQLFDEYRNLHHDAVSLQAADALLTQTQLGIFNDFGRYQIVYRYIDEHPECHLSKFLKARLDAERCLDNRTGLVV